MGMTPEGRIKTMLRKKIDAAFPGNWTFMPVQSGFGKPALDFIFCIGGLFVSIETKKDSKSKLTPLQVGTLDMIKTAGGQAYVVYDAATADAAIASIHLALRFAPCFPRSTNIPRLRPSDASEPATTPAPPAASKSD